MTHSAVAIYVGAGASVSGITVKDIDGSPSVSATTLEVTNGFVSDQTGGVARLTLGSMAAEAAASYYTSAQVDSVITALNLGSMSIQDTGDYLTTLDIAAAYQPLDGTLSAFAALTIAANTLTIGTGADAFSQTAFAANTFPARASTGNLEAKTITDFGLSLVNDATASDGRTTLGLGTMATATAADYSTTAAIAAAYQPLDGDLTSWAGVTRASGFDTFVATPTGANLASLLTTALPVTKGGTALTSATAYAVLCGGTTSTGAFQSIASVGTSGHVLTSNGAGALPTFQAAAGGTAIEIDTVAWCEADGNDGTAAVGDPAKPYLTMAAAYTAGARTFMLGSGTFAGLSVSGAITIKVFGIGKADSIITSIVSTNGGTITVTDLGLNSVQIGTIGAVGAIGAAGVAGTPGSSVTIRNVSVGTILSQAGSGGDNTGGDGGAGGDSGSLNINGACVVTTITAQAGTGGNSDGSFAPGNGGGGSTITIEGNSLVGDITCVSGNGGDSTDVSAPGGNGGNAGSVVIDFSKITGTVTLTAGLGGGGDGDGTAGTPGAVTMMLSRIATLDVQAADTEGTLVGELSSVGTLTSAGTDVTGFIQGTIDGAAV